MAKVSNFKINERSNVERSNLWVTKTGNKNWKNWFISEGKYENRQNCENWKISNKRIIPKLPIFGFWNWKKFRNLFIFIFRKFQKMSIWKIPIICNLENSENLRYEKFKKLEFGEF